MYTPPVVPATLAVGESIHFAGELSLLDTGEFQLSSIKNLNNKGNSGKFNIPKNKDSILNIDAARDSEGNVIDIHVAACWTAIGTILMGENDGTNNCLETDGAAYPAAGWEVSSPAMVSMRIARRD